MTAHSAPDSTYFSRYVSPDDRQAAVNLAEQLGEFGEDENAEWSDIAGGNSGLIERALRCLPYARHLPICNTHNFKHGTHRPSSEIDCICGFDRASR